MSIVWIIVFRPLDVHSELHRTLIYALLAVTTQVLLGILNAAGVQVGADYVLSNARGMSHP